MDDRFNYTASTLTDQELKDCIDSRQKYLPETIEAAVAELKNRKHTFTKEELQVITQDIQARRDNAALPTTGNGLFSNDYKNNIVEDPAAPELYSRRTLYVFTVLFGALFGSVMLAINIGKLKDRAGANWVLLFGIGFTVLQVIVLKYANTGTGTASIVFGIIAAYILDYSFWDRFIGRPAFYRARAVWVPLIIALALCGLIVWGAYFSGGK